MPGLAKLKTRILVAKIKMMPTVVRETIIGSIGFPHCNEYQNTENIQFRLPATLYMVYHRIMLISNFI